MNFDKVIQVVYLCFMTLLALTHTAPVDSQNAPNGFWFGTQDLNCVASKGFGSGSIFKRSVPSEDAPERSTMAYVHRLVFYKGNVYEWGVGTQGYHIGPTASVSECPVTWEANPAGSGTCHPMVLEVFTKGYRARYGVYNLVTNNCHHYANRLAMLLSTNACSVGEDRWQVFSAKFKKFIKRFTSVFDSNGEVDNEKQEEITDGEWPIVHWYKK